MSTVSSGFGWLLFSFQGRLNRQPWWLASLALWLISSVLMGVIFSLLMQTGPDGSPDLMTVPLWVHFIGLIFLWPILALGCKRLHDTDRSGWWQLLNFIPVIGGLIVFVICGFFKGTDSSNRYGPDPLMFAD